MEASTRTKESTTPPPIIGKVGRYTVFLTPPSTPKPTQKPTSDSPKTPPQTGSPKIPPPIQPPPQQFEKKPSPNSSSLFEFFWNAVSKVQDVHSNVDEYLADWFGLNQSRYQWALNDYYESKGILKLIHFRKKKVQSQKKWLTKCRACSICQQRKFSFDWIILQSMTARFDGMPYVRFI